MDSLNSQIPVPKSNNQRIIIIGGGFGGIRLAQKLKNKGFQVVMFDRHNYHTFQPLLYQVATAGLEPDSIAGSLRQQLENMKDFYFRMANVYSINPDENTIETEIGNLSYDYLVIATGSKTNYYGNESIMENGFPLKQIPQALDLRSHILQNFEKAVIETNPAQLKRQMNIVIVGGGPTGVELAGAIGELKRSVLPKDYPELDFSQMQITLIEGQGRLLSGMSDKSAVKALEYVKKFGVGVKLNQIVESYDGQVAKLKNGETIETTTLIWAAGVQGNVPDGINPDTIERSRIIVNEYNLMKGSHNVFAIGDVAILKTPDNPNGYPMLAPVAIQQGLNLAKNLVAIKKGKALTPYKFSNQGTMATIGRNKAVVDLPGNITVGGLMAWLIWMFVHLMSIIGLRNKLVIFSNWAWNYFTYDRGTRLIIRKFDPKNKIKEEHVEL